MDDPFIDNHVNCRTISLLEVGAPLSDVTYPFDVDGYTYHLQSLAFASYFGAPRNTSVNKWYSLNNDLTANCGF